MRAHLEAPALLDSKGLIHAKFDIKRTSRFGIGQLRTEAKYELCAYRLQNRDPVLHFDNLFALSSRGCGAQSRPPKKRKSDTIGLALRVTDSCIFFEVPQMIFEVLENLASIFTEVSFSAVLQLLLTFNDPE